MRVRVTTNAGALAAEFAEMAQSAEDIVADELAQIAPGIVADSVAATPERTGKARRSWTFRRVKAGVSITNSVRYARFIRDGQLVRAATESADRRVTARLDTIARRLMKGRL